MRDRFTDSCSKAMHYANVEAMRFGQQYVATEHILVGLIREGTGIPALVFQKFKVTLGRIRLEVEKIINGQGEPVSGHLPLTPLAKRVIEFAVDEAKKLNHDYIGTGHLLLGLTREEEGVAARVLVNVGLSLSNIREEVLNLLGSDSDQPLVMDAAPVAPDCQPLESKAAKAAGELLAHLQEMKEIAVASADFERAAMLREQAAMVNKLKQLMVDNSGE